MTRIPLPVLAALGAVVAVALAPEAAAQVVSPNPPTPPIPNPPIPTPIPNPSYVVPPPVLDTIVDDFRTALVAARPALLDFARGTFGILVVIELALSAIIWTLKRDSPADLFASLVLKVAWLAFCLGLIASFDVWFPVIIEGFQAAGQTVAPGTMSPGDVLALGVELSVSMINGFFDGLTLLDMTFTMLGMAFLVALAALVIELMYAVIAATIVIVIVESLIALAVGALILGFSAFRGTASLADRFVAYVFNLGIRLFCLFLLVGVGYDVAQGWLPLIQGGTTELSVALAVLGGSLTFMLLVIVVPYKVSTLLTRDIQIGFERALNAA